MIKFSVTMNKMNQQQPIAKIDNGLFELCS